MYLSSVFIPFFLCGKGPLILFRVLNLIVVRHNFFFRGKQRTCHEEREKEERTIMGGRRKNPNPKRAENARTVLKGDAVLEERGGGEEEEEEEPEVLLCLRIPDDEGDADEVNEQMRKEEMTVRKGAKRKRGQHECGVCEKVFVSASKLAIHMRIHTNERPYECDVCEKCFHTSGNLERHMRIHTNEKPYKCDMCDEAFRQSQHLQSHMRIHTNEKPYECDMCEKCFRRADGLTKHMRTQH